jgi:hypothetical protein
LGLFLAILTSSCGFLSDEPVENQDLYNSREPLGPSCELDPDRLSRILDEDVSDQIHCLRENFLQFSRFVITQDPDRITQNDLSLFIQKFFASNSQAILRALHLMFELNMVMLRDHASTLSRDNIDSLTELLIQTNREGIIITRIMRDMTSDHREKLYPKARRDMLASLRRLSRQTIHILEQSNKKPQNLNLRRFIIDLNLNFDLGTDIIEPELVDSMLFLKRVLLGGRPTHMSSLELIDLLRKMPELFIETFDLLFVRTSFFADGERGYQRFLQQKIVNLTNLMHPLDSSATLFTEDDLYRIYNAMLDQEDKSRLGRFDLVKLRPMVRSLKRNILGGSEKKYNADHLRGMLLMANTALEGSLFFDEFRELTRDLKDRPTADIIATRAPFVALFQRLETNLYKRLDEIKALPEQMKVFEFLKDANHHFVELTLKEDFIDVLARLKDHFIGDTIPGVLTADEFQRFLVRAAPLAELFYDLTYLVPAAGKDGLELHDVLNRLLSGIEALPLVARTKGTFLKRNDLHILIREFVGDAAQQRKMQNLVDSFTGNILRTNLDEISVEDLSRIFVFGEMLTSTLEFLPEHNELLTSLKEASDEQFPEQRRLYLLHVHKLIEKFRPLIAKAGVINGDILYQDFLSDLNLVFDSFELDKDLIEDLAPLKRLLFGGRAEEFSRAELLALLDTAQDVLPWVIDFMYGPKVDDLFYVQFVQVLKRHFFDLTSTEELIRLPAILKLAERFTDLPLRSFRPTVAKFKQRILGGPAESIRGIDLGRIFALVREVAEYNFFNEVTYSAMQQRLDTIRTPITLVPRYDLPQYRHLSAANIDKYHALFSDAVTKHRYFRNSTDGMQNWGHEIVRNKQGFKELSLLKWLIGHIIRGWGSPTPNVYQGYALSVAELEQLLVDAKPVLEEFDMWTSDFDNFARNTLLLGDLFQNRSNGDQRLDIDEFTEYALLVLSAVDLIDNFVTSLSRYCPPTSGTDPKTWEFDTHCYRPHFFKIILDEFGYAKYLPMLNRYVKFDPPDDVAAFLRNVEGFARRVDDDRLPMERRDFVLLLGALINIETTFLRFDTNRDNVIGPQELDVAFEIYEAAIIQIAGLDEGSRKYARSIFLYMVKHMAIPSRTQLITFHYLARKNISALRLNIGALLYYLVND